MAARRDTLRVYLLKVHCAAGNLVVDVYRNTMYFYMNDQPRMLSRPDSVCSWIACASTTFICLAGMSRCLLRILDPNPEWRGQGRGSRTRAYSSTDLQYSPLQRCGQSWVPRSSECYVLQVWPHSTLTCSPLLYCILACSPLLSSSHTLRTRAYRSLPAQVHAFKNVQQHHSHFPWHYEWRRANRDA